MWTDLWHDFHTVTQDSQHLWNNFSGVSQPEIGHYQCSQCKPGLGSQAKRKGFLHIKGFLYIDSNKQGKRRAYPVPVGQIPHILQCLGRMHERKKKKDSLQT